MNEKEIRAKEAQAEALADDELGAVAGGNYIRDNSTGYQYLGRCLNTECIAYAQLMNVPERDTKCPMCGKPMNVFHK